MMQQQQDIAERLFDQFHAMLKSKDIRVFGDVDDPLFAWYDIAKYINDLGHYRDNLADYDKKHAIIVISKTCTGCHPLNVLTQYGLVKYLFQKKSLKAVELTSYIYDSMEHTKRQLKTQFRECQALYQLVSDMLMEYDNEARIRREEYDSLKESNKLIREQLTHSMKCIKDMQEKYVVSVDFREYNDTFDANLARDKYRYNNRLAREYVMRPYDFRITKSGRIKEKTPELCNVEGGYHIKKLIYDQWTEKQYEAQKKFRNTNQKHLKTNIHRQIERSSEKYISPDDSYIKSMHCNPKYPASVPRKQPKSITQKDIAAFNSDRRTADHGQEKPITAAEFMALCQQNTQERPISFNPNYASNIVHDQDEPIVQEQVEPIVQKQQIITQPMNAKQRRAAARSASKRSQRGK